MPMGCIPVWCTWVKVPNFRSTSLRHHKVSCTVPPGTPTKNLFTRLKHLNDDCPFYSAKPKKICIVSNKRKWVPEEEAELKKIFKSFFTTNEYPGLRDCEKAIKISKMKGGLIWKRPRDNIKKKVNNMVLKGQ